MSNSTRNTIILSIILILITAMWIVVIGNVTRKTAEITASNKRAQISIDSLTAELSAIDTLKAEYELKKALMQQQSKFILGMDNPTVTYEYLLGILKLNGLNVDYDFAASQADSAGAMFHDYVISGKTHYNNLLRLTHQIENQRAVITIEDLSIASASTAEADTVSFSMMLRTHFRDGGPLLPELEYRELGSPYLGYSLFKVRIADEVLPFDVDPDLLNVEDAKLIGITRGMAFFRDGQGIIRILTKGSKVAYGYLFRIDEALGKVVFRLAKYGLEEDYTVLISNE